MGFWNAIGKIAQGKPVFEVSADEQQEQQQGVPPEVHQAEQSTSQAAANPYVDAGGRKVIPSIRMERVAIHRNGPTETVRVWITNTSPFEIELDKIDLLGQRREIDRRLRSGEGHEVIVYEGPVLKDDHATKSILQYKITGNGDYFSLEHQLEYHFQGSDQTYSISEFRESYPVRDI